MNELTKHAEFSEFSRALDTLGLADETVEDGRTRTMRPSQQWRAAGGDQPGLSGLPRLVAAGSGPDGAGAPGGGQNSR